MRCGGLRGVLGLWQGVEWGEKDFEGQVLSMKGKWEEKAVWLAGEEG